MAPRLAMAVRPSAVVVADFMVCSRSSSGVASLLQGLEAAVQAWGQMQRH